MKYKKRERNQILRHPKICVTTEIQQWTRYISSNVTRNKWSKIETEAHAVLVRFKGEWRAHKSFWEETGAGIWQPFVLLCKRCIPNIPVWMHTDRGMRVWLNVFHCVPKPLSMRLLAATHCDRVYVSAAPPISVYLLIILSKNEASKNKNCQTDVSQTGVSGSLLEPSTIMILPNGKDKVWSCIFLTQILISLHHHPKMGRVLLACP